MAAPNTAEEFLDLVRKSEVLEEKRLETYLQRLQGAGGVPAEASKLAGLMVRDGILTQFQAEQVMAGKWRRFSIGKYKVLERIGTGGMGTVYLCEHKLMRRRVAVKILPNAKAADDASRERFYREGRAAAALDHPNIVHAYDIDQDEQLHFIVMEYVDGASLQEIVKKSGPLDVTRACHYIRDAALGLQHAHEKGLVHRDIKPGNILVDRNGIVKLLDMGLARFFNDEEDVLTKKYDENVLGTADYLSPEQAIDSHSVDIRADIYSLGATLYFLLTGRPPFADGSVAQKLIAHQTRMAKSVTEFRKDVPPGLAAVVTRAMAKEPEQRFALPREMADALAPFTRAAIAPPPEAEMPRLSRAATLDGPSTVVTRSEPVTPPRLGAGSGSSARRQPAPPPRATPTVATPPPARATAPPSVRPAPPAPLVPAPLPATIAHDELAPWATNAAPDTADHRASDDTSPEPHASSRRLAIAQAEVNRTKHRLWMVVIGLSIPFVLILAVLLYLYLPRGTPAPQATRATKLVVTKEAGKTGVFASVKQALRSAQAGDVIEIADEVHKETLVVDVGVGVGKAPASITLQAAPGREVVWVPANPDEREPIIKLTHAAGFTMKGRGITLDGHGRVKDLMVVTLQSPGLTVEDLTLKGYTKSGILLMNTQGDEKTPITLKGLTFDDVSAVKPAIYLDANPDVQTVPFNDYIDVSDLHVGAGDIEKAIQSKDNTVLGARVRLNTGP